MRICEALMVCFFSDKFCKNSFWKLLSLCSNPVLHLMISLALACSASRLCPVETETAKIMTNFCAFVAYQIHRKAMTSAGCFPLWPATQMLQQNHEGKSHLRIWGHGCIQRDLQCSRPDHEPCIGWCLVEYPDGLTVGFGFFMPHFFLQLLRWLQLWEKWPSVHKTRGFRKCLWAWPMMCEKGGGLRFPMCNFRFDSPAQKKTASWPGLQGPYLWLTQDRFCSIAEKCIWNWILQDRPATCYKWSYGGPYKWPYKWVSLGVSSRRKVEW